MPGRNLVIINPEAHCWRFGMSGLLEHEGVGKKGPHERHGHFWDACTGHSIPVPHNLLFHQVMNSTLSRSSLKSGKRKRCLLEFNAW